MDRESIRTKYHRKTLTWEDLKLLDIEEVPSDREPYWGSREERGSFSSFTRVRRGIQDKKFLLCAASFERHSRRVLGGWH